MGVIKGILALGLFFLFSPLILFSVAALIVILWSAISFLLSIVPFLILAILILLLVAIFVGIIKAEIEIRKRDKFYKTFKTYEKNKVPSQFYLY